MHRAYYHFDQLPDKFCIPYVSVFAILSGGAGFVSNHWEWNTIPVGSERVITIDIPSSGEIRIVYIFA